MATPSKRPPKSRIEAFIPLIAGGVGGTTGAIVTCPLEVVKTRLQSSNSGFPDDYVSVKGKHSIVHLKRKGKGKGGGPGGTAGGGAGGVAQNSDIQKTAKQGAIADSKHAKHKVVAVEQIAAEKRAGPLQTTIPVASKSAANASITSNIAASSSASGSSYNRAPTKAPSKTMNVFQCLKFIYVTEGVFGLWKGIGPNLMGVAPSRAIYFWAYSTAKKNINSALPRKNRDTPFVHVVSAMSAGFSASTTTNPVWLIKTRLQLDRDSGKHRLTIRKTIRNIYNEGGFLGFWKGVTASYWGISETVIHFVIYEALKKQLANYQDKRKGQEKTFIDFAGFMLCGACSKTCATCIAYPHEVARTRLREEGSRYKSFWQSLGLVYREEGRRGLYRGLATQLVRQIPNTAIMMSTYELTVYVLTKWLKGSGPGSGGHDDGHQLKSDLRDAASDSNTSSARSDSEIAKQPTSAVRLKTAHSQ